MHHAEKCRTDKFFMGLTCWSSDSWKFISEEEILVSNAGRGKFANGCSCIGCTMQGNTGYDIAALKQSLYHQQTNGRVGGSCPLFRARRGRPRINRFLPFVLPQLLSDGKYKRNRKWMDHDNATRADLSSNFVGFFFWGLFNFKSTPVDQN